MYATVAAIESGPPALIQAREVLAAFARVRS